MKTTACPKCKKKYEFDAFPERFMECSCGYKFIPRQRSWFYRHDKITMILIALAFTVPFCWVMMKYEAKKEAAKPVTPHVVGKMPGSAVKNSGGLKYEAAHMAKQFVKKKLIAPESAQFPGNVNMVVLGPKRWKFSGKVNSRNNAGAITLSRYYAVVEYSGNEKWNCTDVKVY